MMTQMQNSESSITFWHFDIISHLSLVEETLHITVSVKSVYLFDNAAAEKKKITKKQNLILIS